MIASMIPIRFTSTQLNIQQTKTPPYIPPIEPIQPIGQDTFQRVQMIPPIGPKEPNPISFGHKWLVKTLWRKGKLPSVTKGFYGDQLTQKNVTVEHLRPLSKGGRTERCNLVLASDIKNNNRGNNDIRTIANLDTVRQYLAQFIGVKLPEFNGYKYIEEVTRTLKKLGIDLKKNVIEPIPKKKKHKIDTMA